MNGTLKSIQNPRYAKSICLNWRIISCNMGRRLMPNPLNMKNEDIRWIQRFQNYQKAFAQLIQAVELSRQRALSKLEKQGLIQGFEYTHELAWNTLKDFLEARGTTNLFGSRDATRAAFALGLLEQGEIWMQ